MKVKRKDRAKPLKVGHLTLLDLGIVFLMPQLRALRDEGFEVHAFCGDGALVPSIEAEEITVHLIDVQRKISPWADLKLLWKLTKIMRREGYTVVHAHTAKLELLGQLAARLARVPISLYTNHGFVFRGEMGRARKALLKNMARLAGLISDHVLSQSEEDVAFAVTEKVYRKERISYLGNGIDVSDLRVERLTTEQLRAKKRELGIPENHKIVGMVGRYVWEKGYREFFEAARIIIREREDVTFVTVGTPLESERDPVDFSVLRELGIEQRVIVLKARNDMPELYSLMDVVALPSHREGFPRTLIEAAAMSRPSVATDIPGCREAVINGYNGFLVPPKDVCALAGKIQLLLTDSVLAAELGKNGRALAEERFDVRKVVDRLRSCYGELLERKLPADKHQKSTTRFSQSAEVEDIRRGRLVP